MYAIRSYYVRYIIPVTLLLIFILIYMALGRLSDSLIVFSTLPFALFGGLLYIDYLGFNISVAVIVGFLALLGVAAETAIVMIIYLTEAIVHGRLGSLLEVGVGFHPELRNNFV